MMVIMTKKMRITVVTVYESDFNLDNYPADITTEEAAVAAEKEYITQGDVDDYDFLVLDGEWENVEVEIIDD